MARSVTSGKKYDKKYVPDTVDTYYKGRPVTLKKGDPVPIHRFPNEAEQVAQRNRVLNTPIGQASTIVDKPWSGPGFISGEDQRRFFAQSPYRSPTAKYTINRGDLDAALKAGLTDKGVLFEAVESVDPYGVSDQWENVKGALLPRLEFNEEPWEEQRDVANYEAGQYASAVRDLMLNEPEYAQAVADRARDQAAIEQMGVRDIARTMPQTGEQLAKSEAQRGLQRLENIAQKSSMVGDMVLKDKMDNIRLLEQETRSLMAKGDTEAAVIAAGLREKEMIRANNIFQDQLRRKIEDLDDSKKKNKAGLFGDITNAAVQGGLGIASIWAPYLIPFMKPAGDLAETAVEDALD